MHFSKCVNCQQDPYVVISAKPAFISSDVGDRFIVEDFELQRQVVYALNSVLYEQLQYKGNECDYYNPLNSYIHQVHLLGRVFSLTS